MSENELLFAAIEKGDKAEVARLLKEGANPNAKDSKGSTPLLLAAVKGESEIIKTLIKMARK
jgi:ankyrin repeat protein